MGEFNAQRPLVVRAYGVRKDGRAFNRADLKRAAEKLVALEGRLGARGLGRRGCC